MFWLAGPVLAVAAVRAGYFWFVARHTPLTGDEIFYFDRADVVLQLIGLEPVTGGASPVDLLVDRGWFMPGMSALVAPVRLLTDDVGIGRAWIGLVNLLGLSVVGACVARHFGRRAGRLTVIGAGLFPAAIPFSFSFWGETSAGLLVAGVSVWLMASARRRPVGFGTGDAARVGVAAAVVVYLRPSFVPIVAVWAGFAVLVSLRPGGGWGSVRRAGWTIGVLAALFGALIAPWSVAVSTRFDTAVVTTTSLDLNAIVSFGDPVLNARRADNANLFLGLDAWIMREAERTDRPPGVVLRRLRSEAIAGLDAGRYVGQVRKNLVDHLLRPNQFLERFRQRTIPVSSHPAVTDRLMGLLAAVNLVAWCAVLAGLAVLVVVPLWPDRSNWFVAVLAKAVVAVSMVQPFVASSSGRYFLAVVPTAVVAAVALATGVQSARPAGRRIPGSVAERMVLAAQWILAASVVAVATLLIAL